LETFTETKKLVPNPDFNEQHNIVLRNINYSELDIPIIELIKKISKLDYCFSLQSCYGHFLYPGENDQLSTHPLPILNNDISIDYRIAYLAVCIKDNQDGESFLANLNNMTLIDPGYLQFGCAEWFWERQINSFILQVEPERFKDRDRITIDYNEAKYVENIRNQFFISLNELIEKFIK
jgi:hypothetical protein